MNRRIITEEELRKDPVQSQIIANLETRLGGEVPQVVIDTMIDIVSWADTIPKQVKQWVRDTIEVVLRIQKGTANSSDYSVCWIRIFEIIERLPTHFSGYEVLYQERDGMSDLAMKAHIEFGEKIREHLVDMIQSLSEDELITLEYERNCNAHIFQWGYRTQVKITEDNKLTKPKVEYDGKPIKQVQAAIDRQLAKYAFRDVDFQKAILLKISPHLSLIGTQILGWSP